MPALLLRVEASETPIQMFAEDYVIQLIAESSMIVRLFAEEFDVDVQTVEVT